MKLALQVKEIIVLENIPERYSNNQFLKAVYLAIFSILVAFEVY